MTVPLILAPEAAAGLTPERAGRGCVRVFAVRFARWWAGAGVGDGVGVGVALGDSLGVSLGAGVVVSTGVEVATGVGVVVGSTLGAGVVVAIGASLGVGLGSAPNAMEPVPATMMRLSRIEAHNRLVRDNAISCSPSDTSCAAHSRAR